MDGECGKVGGGGDGSYNGGVWDYFLRGKVLFVNGLFLKDLFPKDFV